MKRTARTALLLLALGFLPADAQERAANPSIQGTVYAVQQRAGSLDVLVGVGMALRIVRLRTPPNARIAAEGAEVPMSALERGDVVRARCHWSGKQLVVDRIEKVAGR